jgi:protein-disulfide isomerase
MKTRFLSTSVPLRHCAGSLLFAVLGTGCCFSQECPSPSSGDLTKIASYVAARYELAPDTAVDDDGTVKGTCFRRLTVRSSVPKRTIALYVSPDMRFLTETLLDTRIDPAKERDRVARETQRALLADDSPTRGRNDTPVTLVMFSDFQCPYCRRFEEMVAALPEEDMQQVRVVFKNMPLAIHEWARPAAKLSICAKLQSPDVFWALHDFLVAKQSDITPTTLTSTVELFARHQAGIDSQRLLGCTTERDVEEALLRDERLAQVYHVDRTPTVFVNGVRSAGFRSAAELRSAIHSALVYAAGKDTR